MTDDHLAKINVRVSRDLHSDLVNNVEWGLRRHLIECVLRLVVDAIKSEGKIMTGAILAGEFKLVRSVPAPSAGAKNDTP